MIWAFSFLVRHFRYYLKIASVDVIVLDVSRVMHLLLGNYVFRGLAIDRDECPYPRSNNSSCAYGTMIVRR